MKHSFSLGLNSVTRNQVEPFREALLSFVMPIHDKGGDVFFKDIS